MLAAIQLQGASPKPLHDVVHSWPAFKMRRDLAKEERDFSGKRTNSLQCKYYNANFTLKPVDFSRQVSVWRSNLDLPNFSTHFRSKNQIDTSYSVDSENGNRKKQIESRKKQIEVEKVEMDQKLATGSCTFPSDFLTASIIRQANSGPVDLEMTRLVHCEFDLVDWLANQVRMQLVG